MTTALAKITTALNVHLPPSKVDVYRSQAATYTTELLAALGQAFKKLEREPLQHKAPSGTLSNGFKWHLFEAYKHQTSGDVVYAVAVSDGKLVSDDVGVDYLWFVMTLYSTGKIKNWGTKLHMGLDLALDCAVDITMGM
jgi:hypothetical protein